jgi:hypothetical protein
MAVLPDYRDLLKVVSEHGCGFNDPQVWYAPDVDAFNVQLRVDGALARRAAYGEGSQLRKVGSAIRDQVDDALRALRYAHRKVPRLGAGTVGYARRRR